MENFEKNFLDFYFEVRSFLYISDLIDENYVIYTQHDEDGRFRVKLFCVNPAQNLQNCMDKGRSTVFFSAYITSGDVLPGAFKRTKR